MTESERLNDLRQRVLAGEDVSLDEYREIIQSLRAKRKGDITDAAVKKASKAKETAPAVDLDTLLGGLGI
jgi:hypothetical protein